MEREACCPEFYGETSILKIGAVWCNGWRRWDMIFPYEPDESMGDGIPGVV